MEDRERTTGPLQYAPRAPRRSWLPSPWLIPTLAGNPLFWFVVAIVIIVVSALIRVAVRMLTD